MKMCEHCGKWFEDFELRMCGGPGCTVERCENCLEEYSDPINPSYIMPLCEYCADRVMEIYYAKLAAKGYGDAIKEAIKLLGENDATGAKAVLDYALYAQQLRVEASKEIEVVKVKGCETWKQ